MNSNKVLIILSCGKKKSEKLSQGKLKASQAYIGPMFQVINKAKRESRWSEDFFLGIISAKYGFLRENQEIEFYDKKMSKKRAYELRDQVINSIQTWNSEEQFSLIYILMGKIYLSSVEKLKDFIDTKVIIEPMEGLGIGQRKLLTFLKNQNK